MEKKQLAATTLATVILTGCGGGSAAPDVIKVADDGAITTMADADGKESGDQKTTSGEAVTITLAESPTSPERMAVLRKITDKYQVEHSNITIDITSPSLENAGVKITQMLMNGSGANITEMHDSTVTQYAINEWIVNLQKYTNAWDEKDTLTESADEVIHYLEGGAYPIPYGFYQRELFYRLDWFEEKGFDQPETWQDIYDVGSAITDPADSKFGCSSCSGPSGHQYADTIYWSWVGTDKVADPNVAYSLKDGNDATIFTPPEVKEALHFYKDLFKNICPADSIAWGFSEMIQSFVGGTTTTPIQDPGVIAACSADTQDGQRALVPFPKESSGRAIFLNGFAGWGMTSFTEHPDKTAGFLLYLSNSENNTYSIKNYSITPIRNNAAEKDMYLSEKCFAMYVDIIKGPDAHCYAAYSQIYQVFVTYKTEVDTVYQKYLTDGITDDELLQWLGEFWAQTYKDGSQKW